VKIIFTADAWNDYLYCLESDQNVLARVNALIDDAQRHPFKGIGKTEPLREEYAGWWSRE
jgi:toxin YoeB